MREIESASRWSLASLFSWMRPSPAQPRAQPVSSDAPSAQRGAPAEPDRFSRVGSGAPGLGRLDKSPLDVQLTTTVDALQAPVASYATDADRRVALFKAIAATVPFDVPDARGRATPSWPKQPWEDRNDRSLAAVRTTVPLSQILGTQAAKARGGDTFLRAWAESSRAELWETPVGKGLAHFALHRYGGALTHDRNDKFGHAALVMAHGDAIAKEQEQRGTVLPEPWRQVIEHGGMLHDVGYMFGGDRHPSKGALDLLINGPAYLKQLGVDIDRTQLERIAVGMMLHGATFPWGDLDRRLPGDHYVDASLVYDVVKPKIFDLKRLLLQDLGAYVALGSGEGRLAWLDDPKEMELLIKTGWMLHCADKYCGPYKDMRRAGVSTVQELDGLASEGRAGRLPIATLAELDKHGSTLGGFDLVGFLSRG